uniref:dolichyl-phosphate beta-glucosyltransferase n=1 Tax=Caenorhabditis tropicalis TaxID=1561998 RepID=A0A1I7T917_9PELO
MLGLFEPGFDTMSGVCVLGLMTGALIVISLVTLSHMTPWIKRRRSEYLEPESVYRCREKKEFQKLLPEDRDSHRRYTPSTCYLSVIIPAMNEAERIGIMLDDCCDYLEARAEIQPEFTYEIIVVDDGSTDDTCDIVVQIGATRKNLRVLKLKENRGKGGAVRMGVLHASGKLILFADADGATKFEDFEQLEKELLRTAGGDPLDESFPAVVVGSRAHLAAASVAERSFFRTILMHGFHSLVYLFAVRTIKDTQCGFKLFTRSIAARAFPVLHVERWAFDVELIYLCEKWTVPVKEVCVRWKEIDGSKITPIWSWLQMGRDLILIWFRYTIGVWNDDQPQ